MFLILGACEAGMFLLVLSLYRAATRPDIWSFLLSTPGWTFLLASTIVAFSIVWAIRILKKCDLANNRAMQLWITMNLVTMMLMLGSAEILARLLSGQVASGRAQHLDEMLLGRVLYPLDWGRFAENFRVVIDRMNHEGSFLVYDPTLGWTVASSASRREKDLDLYFSSVEGLRSPRAGMSFADLRARHSTVSKTAASIRIALIGDSFTFGDEVRCEESWGHALETLLQPHTQVLNFGVNAYGLNQVLLRYEKDVRMWQPQIVVIGIFGDMIKRTTNIYPLLRNPEWNLPFARPRLVMKNGVPSTINSPVPGPGDIFSRTGVDDLPFLDFDDYYRPFQWERGGMWYLLEKSYLFRFAYSFRSPADGQEEVREEKALQVSQFLIQRLVREVLDGGAVPLVVYHPSKRELLQATEPQNGHVPLAVRLLHNAKIEYVDATHCLSTVSASDAYLEGGHYSPQANLQVARCLEPVLREMLNASRRSH